MKQFFFVRIFPALTDFFGPERTARGLCLLEGLSARLRLPLLPALCRVPG